MARLVRPLQPPGVWFSRRGRMARRWHNPSAQGGVIWGIVGLAELVVAGLISGWIYREA